MHKNASPRYYSLLTGSPTDVARPADTHTAPAAMSQDQVMTILERYSPSVNADIARLLRSTYEAKDSMEADLHSARIYVLPATQPRGPELIETIEYCFSNPSRYAYDSFQMTVTTVADVDFLIRVIRAKLPCLRTCRVDSRYYDVESASYLNPPKFDFSALFAVAVASPYLDRLVFDLPGTTQLLYQLIPQCFRDDDPHPPMDVEFKDGSLALRRRLPLVSLKAVIGRPRVENSPIVALKFFSTVFNVRRRNAMAYSSFLSDLIATLPVADHVEVPIPEAYINAAGESESENRYSTVDVRLAVLWMNDYADDEVHAVLTKSPTPRHHVSLVGRHFYNEHIKGPNGDDVLGMKRCVSLLALSHFLHIATLECLAASLLVSCASP